MLITWEAVHVWGWDEFGEISILSSQPYCEPKTALKILSIF